MPPTTDDRLKRRYTLYNVERRGGLVGVRVGVGVGVNGGSMRHYLRYVLAWH